MDEIEPAEIVEEPYGLMDYSQISGIWTKNNSILESLYNMKGKNIDFDLSLDLQQHTLIRSKPAKMPVIDYVDSGAKVPVEWLLFYLKLIAKHSSHVRITTKHDSPVRLEFGDAEGTAVVFLAPRVENV